MNIWTGSGCKNGVSTKNRDHDAVPRKVEAGGGLSNSVYHQVLHCFSLKHRDSCGSCQAGKPIRAPRFSTSRKAYTWHRLDMVFQKSIQRAKGTYSC